MKGFLYFFIGCLFLFASSCKDDPKTTDEAQTVVPEKVEVEKKSKLNTSQVRLVCQETNDPNQEPGSPQHEVFLYLAESKVKVADVLSCEEILPEDYENYQIPADAIIAVGGWWAGAGDYFYVVQEEENFVVKRGEMYEEKEGDSYDYKTVMTYSAKGEEVF